MSVSWKEAALAGLVVALFALHAGMPRGFLVALAGALAAGLLAGAAYGLLMPFVVRWAAKGVKPREEAEEDEPEK